jgi:hypothetical protein
MQTQELIGPRVAMGHTQAYGVIHYLDYSLLDDYSFPVKKLHHKTISHLFSRVANSRGYKDNICAAKKTQIKFSTRCLESLLNFQHSLNIKRLKKNHLESQTNAQNNKRYNLPIKIAAVWQKVSPSLNRSRIFVIFLLR